MEIKGNRYNDLDAVKGICILLVVCGHCEAPFTHWLYLFHVSAFYIVSGYCWNDRHSHTIKDIRSYIWSKVKRLYVPYVICNGIFVLLNNLFIKLGIYTTSTEFLKIAGEGANYGIARYYTAHDMVVALAKTFAFSSTQLGGATWFIAVLFIITVGHALVEYMIIKTGLSNIKAPIFCLLTVILIIGTWLIRSSISAGIITMLCALMISYASYLIGILLKRHGKELEGAGLYTSVAGIAAFIILLIMNRIGSIGIGDGSITNPIFFMVVTLCGWIMLLSAARYINGLPQKVLVYIGRNTLPIVFLHFLCFKVVSLLYLLITKGNEILLASFPVISGLGGAMWIAYLLAGVTIPLALNELKKRIINIFHTI